MEEVGSKFSEFEHKPTYYSVHRQWIFPRETAVEDIHNILKSVYNDVQSEEQITFADGQRGEQATLF